MMQMTNPIQIQMGIKKFLTIIISIQIAILGLIGLSSLGFDIPIVRQLIGFIYLTFVPGIIILRILKLHKLGNTETLLYAVGLSLATLMFTGLFMNFFYPFIGIVNPISEIPSIIAISFVISILCIIDYIHNRGFSVSFSIDIKELLSPYVFFLLLLPFLSIFGIYLINFHNNNMLLFVFLVIISMIPILVAFDCLPRGAYPLAVITIAIALLFHRSLVIGNVPSEYYLLNLVKTTSFWDPTIPINPNAMLSIVMLGPIFSDICGISSAYVCHIIYPLLFSLVPLGLYRIYQKQTDDKIAFISCFFFMSVFSFFIMLPKLPRQEVAEIFFVLLILLLSDKSMNNTKRNTLLILFSFSLIVSHYATSYVYMCLLIASWFLLLNKWRGNKDNKRTSIVTPAYISLFIVLALTWNIHISSSSIFNTIVNLGHIIVTHIYTDFLNPATSQGLNYLMRDMPSLLYRIYRILHYITQFLIIIGILSFLKRKESKETKIRNEYVAFSEASFAILLATTVIPFFSGYCSLDLPRLYHIVLLFLAPFCIIGSITTAKLLSNIIKIPIFSYIAKRDIQIKILSLFFAIFFLFNSGFIFEIAKNQVYPNPISIVRIKEGGNIMEKTYYYAEYYTEQDALGAWWLSEKRNGSMNLYGDYYATGVLAQELGIWWPEIEGYKIFILTNCTEVDEAGYYVYLRYFNYIDHVILDRLPNEPWDIREFSSILDTASKIYSNGGSVVYYSGR